MNGRKYLIEIENNECQAIQYLSGMARDTRSVTLNLIKKLTAEEVDWQYRTDWNTIGALLDHIAAVEHFFRIEFIAERKLSFEELQLWEPALDMGKYLPELIGIKSPEDYERDLAASGEMFDKALNKIDPEQFTRKRTEYDEQNGSNLAWALYHKVEDEIYHRGQISMIRKLYNDMNRPDDRDQDR